MNTLLETPELCEPPMPETEIRPVPPKARLLGELVRPNRGNDANELLENRFLCRGGGLLFCGPTGIGKSSWAMQAAILWALGRACFGIKPARPLKSLLIQAENDDGDLAEMRDGVIAGLGLTPDEAKAACDAIMVVREDSRTGLDFFLSIVRPLLEEHRPDMLWIDPALAYLGAEAAAQKDVTAFLRNYLNPLVREFNCAVVIVHHTNKPSSGREKSNWSGNDFAYLGSGSIEWANWARAIVALRGLGSHEVFELRAAKRGARLGWKDADDSTSYAKLIAHAKEPGVICWREVDPDEIETGGRPKSYDPDEIFALLPPEGLATGDWQKQAKSECGVSESTFHRERRAFQKSGRILKSKVSGKWQPVQKR
jgi:AAA domain